MLLINVITRQCTTTTECAAFVEFVVGYISYIIYQRW